VSDRDELSVFCAVQFPKLVGALTLYSGNRAIAEELAQEALIRACQHWHRVRRLDRPASWVHHVALNLARSHLRRGAAQRRAEARLEAPVGGNESTDANDSVALRAALAGLPHRKRAVLILRYYAGLSVIETANYLGLPEGTVKRLAHEAIEALRRTPSLQELREVSDVN
jgi:RNA polymerase sigma factor (sigma-70 family)